MDSDFVLANFSYFLFIPYKLSIMQYANISKRILARIFLFLLAFYRSNIMFGKINFSFVLQEAKHQHKKPQNHQYCNK